MMNHPCCIPQPGPYLVLMAPLSSNASRASAMADLLKLPVQFNSRRSLSRNWFWNKCCFSSLNSWNDLTPWNNVVPSLAAFVQAKVGMRFWNTLHKPLESKDGGVHLETQPLPFFMVTHCKWLQCCRPMCNTSTCATKAFSKVQTCKNALLTMRGQRHRNAQKVHHTRRDANYRM